MRRTKLVLLTATALVLAASATGASAADAVTEAPIVATGPSWTGFYIGIHGGAASTTLDYDLLPVFAGDDTTSYRFAEQEFAYGVHGGFDYQFAPRWVAGVELDYTHISADYEPFSAGGLGTLASIEHAFSASGRLGYLVTPQTLAYGKVGYAGIRVEAEEGFDGTASDTLGALAVGGGIETFLWGNLTGRVDATYFSAQDELETTDLEAFEPKTLLVTAGLSYRFGAQANAREVTPAAETSFNGFYLGVAGGIGSAQLDRDIDVPGATVDSFGDESGIANGFIGYDLRFGNVVAGVEGEYSYLKATFDDPDLNSFFTGATDEFAKLDGIWAVSGRLGYVVTPSTLVYAKAGYAGFMIESNGDFFAADGDDDKDLLNGYQVGAGVETALSEHVSLRVEGLYAEAVDQITIDNSQFDQVTIEPRVVSGKVGLAIRF
ncbi:outer membrane beta-barrel protein [Mesorhizobium sp. RP14(2022)]|uniref:Outer membrane beta-barrel protein n=1 Tax=Mesorhizobium liriopis TaxID=2953882 RepID=A0ABT1C5X2_9HYPH|nr:outer membrane beta-barrel protein [Mesorhizobium liriopis]MCO6049625.1 outer membrane beta-barrel protein [Mesorhizobium liriopis]